MTFNSDEIREEQEKAQKLPSTHKRGYHGYSDDVAEDIDGQPTHVPSPGNPEDRYSD